MLRLTVLALLCTAICVSVAAGGVIYVTRDKSLTPYRYYCDGVSDNVEINQALAAAASSSTDKTVYLRGGPNGASATYVISASITIGSNVTLTGDATAIVKLVSSAGWSTYVPMIGVTGTSSSYKRNITIYGFQVDGNDAGNGGSVANGRGHNYYNMIGLEYVRNVKVHDMYLHNNCNDGVRISNSDSVYVYNSRIIKHGHDGVQALKSRYIEVYGNTIQNRTNCSARFDNVRYGTIRNNTMYTADGDGGSGGVQIQSSGAGYAIVGIKIFENRIYDTYGPGMWMFSYGTPQYNSDIYVHNNVIYNCGKSQNSYAGGMIIGGFTVKIENNTIDDCYGGGILLKDVYGGGDPAGSGYVLTLKNNLITHNLGYAVSNTQTGHTVNMSYDCIHGNNGTFQATYPINRTNYITSDPLFASESGRDYHLQSKYGRWNGSAWVTDGSQSPCIDAGDPATSYSNEPAPNGNRINMGADGNTAYASKSGSGGGGAASYVLDGYVNDSYTGATSGYCFKQVLIDGQVVWEEDAAGAEGGWLHAQKDVTSYISGKNQFTLTLRVCHKQKVTDFPLDVYWDGVSISGLAITNAGMEGTTGWTYGETLAAFSGAYSTSFKYAGSYSYKMSFPGDVASAAGAYGQISTTVTVNKSNDPAALANTDAAAVAPIDQLVHCDPNPLIQSTTIRYQVFTGGKVWLGVYNIAGQKVRALVNGTQPQGMHQVQWDGKDANGQRVSAGVYMYRLQAGNQRASGKITVLR
jgi:hypothetical protein